MDSDFTQDAVLHFLQSSGGSVKNSDLLLHFRPFLRDHADRDRNRELFKKFVNSVATVRQTDGVSFVVLRKKFKGHVSGEGGSSGAPWLHTGKKSERTPENARRSPGTSAEKPRQKPEETTPAPPGETARKTILPAAGIMLNNNNNVETNLNLNSSPVQVETRIQERPKSGPADPVHGSRPGQQRASSGPGTTPGTREKVPERITERSDGDLHPEPRLNKEPRLHPEPQLHPEPPLHQQPPLNKELHLHQEPRLHQDPRLHPEPRLNKENHLHQELPFRQEPRLHQDPRLPQESHLHQELPLHQQPPLNKEPRLHQEAPLHPEPRLHQPPRLHQEPRLPQESRLHQELPLHPEPRLHQPPRLHQDPRLPQQPRLHPEPPLHQQPPLNKEPRLHPEPRLLQESHFHQELPLHQDPRLPQQHHVAPRRIRHRPSYKSAVSYDDDEEEEEEEEEVPVRRGSSGGVRPLNAPLGDALRSVSASSPGIVDPPAPSSSSPEKKQLPQICIQDVDLVVSTPPGPGRRSEPASRSGSPRQAAEATSNRNHSVHQEPRLEPRPTQRLSSSHSSIFSPPSDASFSSSVFPPSGSPRTSRWNSSSEDLQPTAGLDKIQDALRRIQGPDPDSEPEIRLGDGKTTKPWHHSTGNLLDDQKPSARSSSPLHRSTDRLHDDQKLPTRVMPWHLSTGDLCDDLEDSDGSTSSPQLRQRPAVARRVSSRLRSRMCRSVGADLDQLLQEEGGGVGAGSKEAARINRLHRISSSLSLHYNLSTSSLSSCSTPPRCGSVSSLVDGQDRKDGRRSLPNTSTNTSTSTAAQHEGRSRQAQSFPLEPREHAWLVKAAMGSWTDIYSLFREDPSLLNKPDFISGFTVLHWIAKHGDHRVLNTLWYGVEKAGLSFDINARATSGHTPLHVAAIHSNKNIVRLLVSKFNADVRLRDTAGKKAWQYLNQTNPPDVFQLLGAPARAAVTGEGGVQQADSTWEHQHHHQQQQRRRRHHFSSASGQRPYTGNTKVKRSTSIAAFLKHKSLHRFYAHQSDSPL